MKSTIELNHSTSTNASDRVVQVGGKMNFELLTIALSRFKNQYEHAIITATLDGKTYANGEEAKQATIRSQRLIMHVHEAAKISLSKQLQASGREFEVYPPIGNFRPELKITGFLKSKDQDLTFLFDRDVPREEIITTGMKAGQIDVVGRNISERALVIGLRSQLSSVNKNFDTLMERAFAETLNLRLRLPGLVMGEIYLLPSHEYMSSPMKENRVEFNDRPVNIEKFVQTFNMISGRTNIEDVEQAYKYERSALIVADFRYDPPYIFTSHAELVQHGLIPANSTANYDLISPFGFCEDILHIHANRHPRR